MCISPKRSHLQQAVAVAVAVAALLLLVLPGLLLAALAEPFAAAG